MSLAIMVAILQPFPALLFIYLLLRLYFRCLPKLYRQSKSGIDSSKIISQMKAQSKLHWQKIYSESPNGICSNQNIPKKKKVHSFKYFEFKLLKSLLFESKIICGFSAVTVGTRYFFFLNTRAWDHSPSCCR